MCDQNNLKDQFITNLNLKRFMCNQNNLKNLSITNIKLQRSVSSNAIKDS